jgi:hypothetical protein
VVSPLADQTFANESSVSAAVQLEPALRQDDQVQVLLDGSIVKGWPTSSTSYFLNNLFRGTHTVQVLVRDATGKTWCSSPVVAFHVTQPSVLAPARR